MPRHAEGPVPALLRRLGSSSAQCFPTWSTGAPGLSTDSPSRRHGALIADRDEGLAASMRWRRSHPPWKGSKASTSSPRRSPMCCQHPVSASPRVFRGGRPNMRRREGKARVGSRLARPEGCSSQTSFGVCRCKVESALDLRKAGREPSRRSPNAAHDVQVQDLTVWRRRRSGASCAPLRSANGQHASRTRPHLLTCDLQCGA